MTTQQERRKARRYGGYKKLDYCEGCGSIENLVIDHDHDCCPEASATNKERLCGKCTRGTLCRDCNAVLRKNITPETLRDLAQYLEDYQIKRQLEG